MCLYLCFHFFGVPLHESFFPRFSPKCEDSRGGGTSKSARGRKSESPDACRLQGYVFHRFWAPFGVPGGTLLENFSQVFAQRRSLGAIGRDSESDFSGNDLFLGFGASFSQIRGLREVLDVHLDWAGAVQTHFGLFAQHCVKRKKSRKVTPGGSI